MKRFYEKLSPDQASVQVFLIECDRCSSSANSAQGQVVPNSVFKCSHVILCSNKHVITTTGNACGQICIFTGHNTTILEVLHLYIFANQPSSQNKNYKPHGTWNHFYPSLLLQSLVHSISITDLTTDFRVSNRNCYCQDQNFKMLILFLGVLQLEMFQASFISIWYSSTTAGFYAMILLYPHSPPQLINPAL